MKKLKVGILGTGNIGTDLLIKVLRSPYLECVCFSGRNPESRGIQKAQSLGINTSVKGVDAFSDCNLGCNLVFDATSALDHYRHARIFAQLGIRVIDMTPAHVGEFCIPSINDEVILDNTNVNMVTCGGQVSTPPIYAISRVITDIQRAEVHSTVAADSIGPATIANIDKYYASTGQAIQEMCGINNVDIELIVDESEPKPDMLTHIRLLTPSKLSSRSRYELNQILRKIRAYVPGYELASDLEYRDGHIEFKIKVRGRGDWVPPHAGNLDIINCAAIAIAEKYARHLRKASPVERLQELVMGLYS